MTTKKAATVETGRKRTLSVEMPRALYQPLDAFRDKLQDDGVKLSSRQVIGRDGISLAMLSWLLDHPEDQRRKLIDAGIASYRKRVGASA